VTNNFEFALEEIKESRFEYDTKQKKGLDFKKKN
jgi:hypothetical protein